MNAEEGTFLVQAVKGSHLSRADAELVKSVLDKAIDSGIELTPEVVLNMATPKKSPLHKFFEWDDTEAARQHRLSQAGNLIRSVRVVFLGPNVKPVESRAYVRVVSLETKRPHYERIETAVQNPNHRAQVLQRALEELAAFRRKYAELNELCQLIDGIVDQINKAG